MSAETVNKDDKKTGYLKVSDPDVTDFVRGDRVKLKVNYAIHSTLDENTVGTVQGVNTTTVAVQFDGNTNIHYLIPERLEKVAEAEVETVDDTTTAKQDPKPVLSLNVAGAKDDKSKLLAGVLGDFSNGLRQVAEIGTFGAKKYTRKGWISVDDAQTRYYDAFWRHILDMGGDLDARDPEHNKRHLAAIAWNALALLEMLDRPNNDG